MPTAFSGFTLRVKSPVRRCFASAKVKTASLRSAGSRSAKASRGRDRLVRHIFGMCAGVLVNFEFLTEIKNGPEMGVLVYGE